MDSIARNTVLFFSLSQFLVSIDAVADSSAITFVRFVPDEAIPTATLQAFRDSGQIDEVRIVTIDTDSLRFAIREAHAPAPSQDKPILTFPLLNESLVSIELKAADEYFDGWQSGIAAFRGTVVGVELSSVQCVIGPDGSVSMTIRVPGRRYAIRKSPLLPYHFYYTLRKDFRKPYE